MPGIEDQDSADVSLLVVSPLAGNIAPSWNRRPWRKFEIATTPESALEKVASTRSRFDVVMVDLLWNDIAHEWSFDGLDLLEAMKESAKGEWVVFSCQGHGFERDHLDEIYHRMNSPHGESQVRGLLLKSNPQAALDAVLTVARGGVCVTAEIENMIRPLEQTIFHGFQRSVRPPKFAGAIAAGHPLDYESLAELLHTSTNYLHKSPATFQGLLPARSNPDAEIGLAEVARWSGEHAHYILSWCRRYGPQTPGLAEHIGVFQRLPG